MIIRKIAQGGMGAVYEAISTSGQEQRLAVKEMSFSVLHNLKSDQKEEMVRSFHREYDLLRTLKHPNLPRAFDYFEEQGRFYFLMEFLDGKTLESILKSVPLNQFIATERVLTWAGQLCDVLDYLHSQEPPIIYRDLKPSNVMELSCSNNIKLFDFGIARFYKSGKSTDTVRFGTDGYLAPEIISHHSQTNVQTDIYALGVVLHELLTRRDPLFSPFLHPKTNSINPDVPDTVSKAIQHALELDPSRRVASVMDFKNELLCPASQRAVPSEAVSRPPPGAERHAPQVKTALPAQPSISTGGSRASPTGLKLATSFLYLGNVRRGQQVDGTLGFDQPPTCTGQIESSDSWLTPSSRRFNPGDKIVVVHADTRRLKHGKWQPQPGPGGFQRLPGILRSWLAFHLGGFVPAVKKHEGKIQIRASGVPTQEVTVRVDVAPPGWKVTLGWLVAIGLLTAEIFILGLIILAVLSQWF